MAVKIASNVSSLQSQRRLSEATYALGKVSEKLSSGLRINRAADDAAGLQISEGLRSDSRVYGQAVRNVNDGLSLLNIAQGSVQQLSNIVIRQAELAEQAMNGTYSVKQRKAMNAEANALVKEYNRIVATTSFNGINTLTGVTNQLRMQLGYGTNGGIDVGVGSKMGFAAGSGVVGTGGTYNAYYELDGSPFSVVTGDINGDSINDIAALSVSGYINILIGNNDGTFKARTTIDGGVGAWDLAMKDLNNDGLLDLFWSATVGSNATVLIGNGDGTFNHKGSFSVGSGPVAITAGDVNGDGILDIISADSSGPGSASVLIGNADGTYQAKRSYATGGAPNEVIAIDLNGDGVVDLATADSLGNTVSILIGNGDGTFRAKSTLSSSTSTLSLAARDLNGDGIQDLVVGDYLDSTVSVFLGNGNGTFRARTTFQSGGTTTYLETGDVNGDGIIDIVTANDASGTIGLLLGNGNGTFQDALTVGGGNVQAISLADMNGDGMLDFVSGDANTSAATVFLGVADTSGRRNNWMDELDLTTKYGAKLALTSSKATLARIGAELGNLGAMQSRLSVANQNLLVSREGFDSARSQLVDADVAQESAALVATRIKQQAAAAVLAQSNQQPALALRLLG